jgi:hypothetical protein
MPNQSQLLLKRSALASAGFEDYDVLADGKYVGRIYKGQAGASGRPWFWGLASDYYRYPSHGYESTREAAMAAFRKCWERQ